MPFLSSIPKLTWSAAVDIVLVATIIYQLILIVRGRRAAHILTGVGIIAISYAVSVWANLELLRSLLSTDICQFISCEVRWKRR